MESFFANLKRELIHFRTYRTRDETRKDIFEFEKEFFNHQYLHLALQYCLPAVHEGIKKCTVAVSTFWVPDHCTLFMYG